MHARIKMICFLLLLASTHAVFAETLYVIDPIHTRVLFQVMHAGLSPSIGTISHPTGLIHYDDHDISKSSVSIEMPLSSLDMGDTNWNEKILSTAYLSAKKFPVARFVSTAVHPLSDTSFSVDGILSVAGKTSAIRFITTLNAQKRHPLSFKQTLGLQATAQFSRKALGVDAWPSLIGDTVFVQLAIEAIRTDSPTLETKPHAD